ncbi:MAG: sodium:calcium antiporter [Janthinobacterium lividum]
MKKPACRQHPSATQDVYSMFDQLPLLALFALFGVAATLVWWAGIRLTSSTDILAQRFGLGHAISGMILLAIATNLPEMAIVASAAWRGDLGVAIGNILGGIGVQTLVLVFLDVFGVRGKEPLSYKAASLVLVLEGVLVVAILVVAIMASRLPPTLIAWRLAPGDVLIAVLWVGGLWLVGRASKGLPWHEGGNAPGAQQAPKGHSRKRKAEDAGASKVSTAYSGAVFLVGAAVTLVCGIVLEASGSTIASRIGMTGVLFGATVLAAATSLPELSTGLTAVRLGDYKLGLVSS